MALIAALGIMGVLYADVDPQTLPYGPSQGTIDVSVGKIVDTRTRKTVTPDDIAVAADSNRFVFLGESHTSGEHHQMQADIIKALVKRGRDVIVGFEMFTRPRQLDLNGWTLGKLTEAEFIAQSKWKTEWGFDYALYRPIFEAIRDNRLPMIALNVPRDWVRTVARKGLEGLSDDEKSQLPNNIDLGWKEHRAVFEAMIGGGGHPMGGPSMDNMYAAQVLWDTGMADSAIKYWDQTPRSKKTVIVIVAGAGHIMYGLGINGRIAKRTGEKGVTVTMVEAEGKAKVSRGIGDYVFAAKPSTKEN